MPLRLLSWSQGLFRQAHDQKLGLIGIVFLYGGF
ncbi:Uncharacterised protein [Vibrio cholerae]|nr:Uncharacterised protein [Vibrio cholerae]